MHQVVLSTNASRSCLTQTGGLACVDNQVDDTERPLFRLGSYPVEAPIFIIGEKVFPLIKPLRLDDHRGGFLGVRANPDDAKKKNNANYMLHFLYAA